MDRLISNFAKKWKLPEPTVLSIYRLIQSEGGKYGRSAKILRSMNIQLSSRQCKYFYRKIRLTIRFGTAKQIGSKNYRKVVQRSS